jgi:hypothetical protein
MAKDKIVSFKADDAFIDSIKKIMDRTGKSKAAVIRICVMRGAKAWWSELKKEDETKCMETAPGDDLCADHRI